MHLKRRFILHRKQDMTRTCSVFQFDWEVKRGKKNGQNSQVQYNTVTVENGFICSMYKLHIKI